MSTPRSPLIVPLSKWQRSKQQSRDAAPTPLILEVTPTIPHQDSKAVCEEDPTDPSIIKLSAPASALALATQANTTACAVCCQHESRYNCPRCHLPYCSVECYRIHTSTTAKRKDGGTNPSSSNSSSSSPCTEEFYQNRVTEILRLEVVEKQDTTRQILNRHYQQQQQEQKQTGNHYSDHLNGDSHNPLEELSEEELYDVLLALDQQEQQYPIGRSVEQDCTINDLQNLFNKEKYPSWSFNPGVRGGDQSFQH
jgi:HIT zinc finger